MEKITVIDNVTPEERKMIAKKRPIDAIRSIRARTGCGLKEAKDIADAVSNYQFNAAHQTAYERALGYAETLQLPKPTSVVIPQGNDWGCAFCSLEYLTGIHRDDIAKEIGHDGSDVIDNELNIPERYATLLHTEAVFWLFTKGYSATSLVSSEYLQRVHNDKHVQFEKRFFPSQWRIMNAIKDKAAELTVKSHRFPKSYHAVTYLAGIILDPRDGHVHSIDEYEIAAALITNIDPYQRLTQIHGAQPKETVTKV